MAMEQTAEYDQLAKHLDSKIGNLLKKIPTRQYLDINLRPNISPANSQSEFVP